MATISLPSDLSFAGATALAFGGSYTKTPSSSSMLYNERTGYARPLRHYEPPKAGA